MGAVKKEIRTRTIEDLLRFVEQLSEQDKYLLLHNLVRTEFEVLIWFENDGALRYVSDNCARVLGCSAAQLRAEPEYLMQMLHPEDRKLWQNHHARAEHDQFQVRIKSSSGEYQLFEHRCVPLKDEQGDRVLGRIGSLANVNERRTEYGDSTFLALGLEKNPLGMVITDAEGIIRYANPAYYASDVCFDSSGAGGDTFHLLTDVSRSAYPEMWRALDAGRSWQGRLKCPLQQDISTWIFINVSPVLDEAGKVLRYVAIVEDVTARLQEEQSLKQQHHELEQVLHKLERIKQEWERSFDCIDQVIAIVDEHCRVRRINKAVTSLYGCEPGDIVGRSLDQVFPPALTEQVCTCKSGEIYDRNLDKWFDWRTFDFASARENENWKILTLHDVTELRRIASELSDAYATQKATQSKLVQQEKMASIGQLAAGVAHEINNPVGFVASNLNTLNKYVRRLYAHITALEENIDTEGNEFLRERARTSRKEHRIQMIEQDVFELIEESLEGTTRVKNIVGNLKSFSRVGDEGRQWTDLHECIEASINIAWNEIKYHAEVRREFSDLPPVFCSAQQMNQVFLNLLVNAAQAINQQGIITVTTAVDGDWAVVQVADTGCGIEPRHLDRIFDPFYTTKEVGKGTGLGLSLCYDMVQKHAGELRVKSTVGKGSTFEVRLPLHAPEEDKGSDNTSANPRKRG
jgi:two-component system NtrC family sensor kinase